MPLPLSLFTLGDARSLGEEMARLLGVSPSAHEERDFEDGEHKCRPLESVRGRDVYVVQSLYGGPRHTVNDKLVRMLFFLGALRDAGAARVTAVAPYLPYQRKERKTKPRDPVSTRYLAGFFEAVGTDRVVSMDVHDLAAYQNSFRLRTEHLEARPLFVEWLRGRLDGGEAAVVSPDAGGVKRADALRRDLEGALGRPVNSAFVEKLRSGGSIRGGTLVGNVRDRTAIVVDDLVSTGGTLAQAARACREGGARRVVACATHGLFVGTALLDSPDVDSVVVTDTVPPFRVEPPQREKLVVVSVAGLFAEAVRRLNEDGSLVDLFETPRA